jgi:tetratricopeptide (TPR) repeat protein
LPEAEETEVPRGKSKGAAPARRTGRWLRRLAALGFGLGLLAVTEAILTVAGYGGPTKVFVTAPDGRGGADFVTNGLAFRRTFRAVPGLGAGVYYPMVPPRRFPAVKPPGTCRIVVFGGSSVMGFPFRRNGAFPRFLEATLQTVCPDTRFEVVNAGVAAINSFSVLERVGEAGSYGADVVVCYAAHNEFYGPYGPASVLPLSSHRTVALAQMWLSRRRLSMAAKDLVAWLLPTPPPPQKRHLGVIMPRLKDVRYDGPFYRRARENFAANIRDIASRARRSGARVVLCTVGCNLRELPPMASVHKPGWERQQEEALQEELRAAADLAASGDLAAAAVRLAAAVDMDPGHAATRFRLARVLDALGRADQARQQYAAARDRDTIRWRAAGDFNEAVRNVVLQLNDPDVVLADCESSFLAAADHCVPGEDLFLDHVHPTPRGNALVAEVIARALAGSPYGQTLGRWDWERNKSAADYARENDLDAIDMLLAYQQTATLWHDIIGETDPPCRQYEKFLVAVAGLEEGLDEAQKRALELAVERTSADTYQEVQLLLALGCLQDDRTPEAEARVSKALSCGWGQTRQRAYAALLLARAMCLQRLGQEQAAADLEATATALAPKVAALARQCSAEGWLELLTSGRAGS